MATYAEEIEQRVINPANAGRIKSRGVFTYMPVWEHGLLIGCNVMIRTLSKPVALLEVYYDGTAIYRPRCINVISQYSPRYAVKDMIMKYYSVVKEVRNDVPYRHTVGDYYNQVVKVLRRKPVSHKYKHVFSVGDSFDSFLTNKFNVGDNND